MTARATTHYYTASSLDGYIATEEHSLDWLFAQDIDEHGPMHYSAFRERIGASLMGANTWQWLLDQGEDWGDLPTWVLTHREFPDAGELVHFTSADPASVHAEMSEVAGDLDVWVVGGGEIAGTFADAGLLDEVWVQYAPVTLGAGAPVLPRRLDLEVIEVARNRDFMCGRYRVVRPDEAAAAGGAAT